VDTSVLVAGVAGLKDPSVPVTPSAQFLHDWIENDTFTWLITSDILDEYTEVLARLGVRPAVIGRIVNLLRAEAEFIETTRTVAAEPDPGDAAFWTCADLGAADFIVTLNAKDFPQSRLSAKVIGPTNHYRRIGSGGESRGLVERDRRHTAMTDIGAGIH